MTTTPTREVVLLDEDGRAVGTMDKRAVHHRDDAAAPGLLLLRLRRRGRAARHPAGAVTSRRSRACGPTPAAATRPRASRSRTPYAAGCARSSGLDPRRRAAGAPARSATAPRWPTGRVENEMCPVFVATTADAVRAGPRRGRRHGLGAVAGVPRRRAGREPRGLAVVPRAGRPACRRTRSRRPSGRTAGCPRRPAVLTSAVVGRGGQVGHQAPDLLGELLGDVGLAEHADEACRRRATPPGPRTGRHRRRRIARRCRGR